MHIVAFVSGRSSMLKRPAPRAAAAGAICARPIGASAFEDDLEWPIRRPSIFRHLGQTRPHPRI
jgi:hypothetical protein